MKVLCLYEDGHKRRFSNLHLCNFNLLNHQTDIDKIYLYTKDPYEVKYQLLIFKHENVVLKNCNDPNAFTEYSSDMNDSYKNIDDYNQESPSNIYCFDDMIAEMLCNKKLKQ